LSRGDSLAVRLHHDLRRRLPPCALLRFAQQLDRDPSGRQEAGVPDAPTRGPPGREHRHLVRHLGRPGAGRGHHERTCCAVHNFFDVEAIAAFAGCEAIAAFAGCSVRWSRCA